MQIDKKRVRYLQLFPKTENFTLKPKILFEESEMFTTIQSRKEKNRFSLP